MSGEMVRRWIFKILVNCFPLRVSEVHLVLMEIKEKRVKMVLLESRYSKIICDPVIVSKLAPKHDSGKIF